MLTKIATWGCFTVLAFCLGSIHTWHFWVGELAAVCLALLAWWDGVTEP